MKFLEEIKSKVLTDPKLLFLSEKSIADAEEDLDQFFRECLDKEGVDWERLIESGSASTPSCGHIFQNGDIIYRCRDCTHDDTCVLCSQCFQDQDHEGHDISFSISKGSGGSCDCGEDESWKTPLSCPRHQKSRNSPCIKVENNADYSTVTRKFSEFLNDIVPTLCTNPLEISVSANGQSSPDGPLALVLFNDEKHSYQDVIAVLMMSRVVAVGDTKSANLIAETIDKHGFATIQISPQKDLESHRAIIKRTALDAEIKPVDFIQEFTFAYIFFSWLSKLVELVPFYREPLMRALLDHEDSILLKMLLKSDGWLMKGTHASLNAVLVKCGLADNKIKGELGLVYGNSFPSMLESYFQGIREPEHSLIHFSVQLFTVSSIIAELVNEHAFFATLCDSIHKFALENFKEHDGYTKSSLEKLMMAFSCVNYIFQDPLIKSSGFFTSASNFTIWIKCCILPFEWMNPQKRAEQEHVLFESKSWIQTFNLQIRLGDLTYTYLSAVEDISIVRNILEAFSTVLVGIENESVLESLHSPIVTCFSLILRRVSCFESISKFFDDSKELLNACGIIFEKSISLMKTALDIEHGMWIRNGWSMISQLNLFRYSSYRSFFFDSASCCLKALLYLRPCRDWKATVQSIWNGNNKRCVDIMISILFSSIFAWPGDEKVLKESIVALLFSGPLTYSQLERLLLDQQTSNNNLPEILKKVSIHQQVGGFNDFTFASKPENKSSFCPHFWLYTPELREKAIEKMSSNNDIAVIGNMVNFSPSSPVSIEELMVLIKPALLTEFSDELADLVNSMEKKNIEAVLSLLHLTKSHEDGWMQRILFPKIDVLALETLKPLISKSDRLNAGKRSRDTSTESEDASLAFEARKRALKRLKTSQSSFKNILELTAGESHISTKIPLPLEGSCILCQENCDAGSESFGTLAYVRPGKLLNRHTSHLMISGCKHLVHRRCYRENLCKDSFNSCPLCNAVFNFYLPIVATEDSSFSDCTLEADSRLVDLESWINAGNLLSNLRRNYRLDCPEEEFKNSKTGFDSFLEALGQDEKFDVRWDMLITDIVAFLLHIKHYEQESRDYYQISHLFVSALASWISLGIDGEFPNLLEQIPAVLTARNDNCKVVDHSLKTIAVSFLLSMGRRYDINDALRIISLVAAAEVRSRECETGSPHDGLKIVEYYCVLLSLWFRIDYNAILARNDLYQWIRLDEAFFKDIVLFPSIENLIAKMAKNLGFSLMLYQPYDLIDLEIRYDKLLVQKNTIACISCGNRPHNPALCLICGEMVCANSYCCFENGIGECSTHKDRCGLQGGIYLLLNKNVVLLLSSDYTQTGLIVNSPYYDKFGQTDTGLRSGKILVLDADRYSILKKIWGSGLIDTYINRHSEDGYENVDWTTF